MGIAGPDERWHDVPDYILGITKEIREDRRIHVPAHRYAKDVVVRPPASVVVGNAGVIAATMATRDGTIVDEWLVRDQGAIVRRLGLEPKAYAAAPIEREGGPERCVRPLTPATDIAGPYPGRGNEAGTGLRYAGLLERIMRAEMSTVPETYDRACRLELPGGVTAHGTAAADEFWMSLRAALPSATFRIEHVIGMEETHAAPRAAVRRSLHGRHDGFGAFGAPTGAEVYVLGIGHAEFGPRGLRREWVLIDETAVWRQILLQTG